MVGSNAVLVPTPPNSRVVQVEFQARLFAFKVPSVMQRPNNYLYNVLGRGGGVPDYIHSILGPKTLFQLLS